MKTLKPTFGALIMSLCMAGFSAYGQVTPAPTPGATGAAPNTQSQPMARSSSDMIKSQYNADKKQCDGMSGNDKDVCIKQAKAKRDSARADAKEAKKEAKARHSANKEKTDANYSVAKEKCDALSGDAKDTCMANAKTRYKK